jgi:hypothetical protein
VLEAKKNWGVLKVVDVGVSIVPRMPTGRWSGRMCSWLCVWSSYDGMDGVASPDACVRSVDFDWTRSDRGPSWSSNEFEQHNVEWAI